jgi:hypothetical protein
MKKYTQHINHAHVAELLTRSSEQLDDEIVAALREARTVALQKQRVHAPVFSLSTVGHRAHHLIPHTTHQWVATAILAIALIAGGVADYLQQTQVPLDLEILTDDLPMEVFVD